MLNKKVAVCMIAKNCEDIIDTSMAWALENFEQINIVVDTENDDDTLTTILKYGLHNEGVNVQIRPFDNFSAQKNRAFALATTPWVLSVDTDEIYEDGIPWDKLVEGMERSGHELASFNLYNLQRDVNHYKGPIEPKIRLMRKDIASMDGKPVDEGLDFAGRKVMSFPYAHIHFGHVRKKSALKLKGKDRIKFKDQDPCDGPGLSKHGEDWFVERNKAWDENVIQVPRVVRMTIERYWG